VLAEAETLFGPGVVVAQERRRHQQALGFVLGEPASLAAHTAWEHYALGRSLLRSGELSGAWTELEQALALEPNGLWTNYYFGLCAYRLQRYEDAALAFSVCVGAAPEVPGCYYNRAVAFTALKRPDRALQDYDRAMQLDPTLASAALNRGMLLYQEKDYTRAAADLQRALEQGANAAVVYYDLALVQLAQNDREAALASVRRALEQDPKHEEARRLRESLQGKQP
jgi:tetratricopeptide (TPR) repeat protein